MAALASSSDPDRMREGLGEAAQDSPAHTYLLHHTAVARAWADEGRGLSDPEVDRTDSGHRVCRDVFQEGYWGGGREADRRCVELTDFAYDDGRVARFRVDGVDPSGALVEGGGARVGSGGVEATVVSAIARSARPSWSSRWTSPPPAAPTSASREPCTGHPTASTGERTGPPVGASSTPGAPPAPRCTSPTPTRAAPSSSADAWRSARP
ncbi:hypothetical protein [Nocardiopsis sp. CNR-923]|uniref:hypothetical protein n=1 Tax=Nocardiopsis sp. CNR-923 TaxID=1904965 RepID=UPI0011805F5F|nr:hypothetical protein [Nocardiopsis sp. CNR-923]